ncbi:MAG: hypothetical protein AB7F64_04515 [Gammaproteobacteria bacterium]
MPDLNDARRAGEDYVENFVHVRSSELFQHPLLFENPSLAIAALEHVALPRAVAEVNISRTEGLESIDALRKQWAELVEAHKVSPPKSYIEALDKAHTSYLADGMSDVALSGQVDELVQAIQDQLLQPIDENEKGYREFIKKAAESQRPSCKVALEQMREYDEDRNGVPKKVKKDVEDRKADALKDLEKATAEAARQATNQMQAFLNKKHETIYQGVLKHTRDMPKDQRDPLFNQARLQQEVLTRYYEPKSWRMMLGVGSPQPVSLDVFNQKRVVFDNGIIRENDPNDRRARLFKIKLSRLPDKAESQLQELAMIMRAEGITLDDDVRAMGKDSEKILGFLAAEGLYKPEIETKEMQEGIKKSIRRAERDLRKSIEMDPREVDVAPTIPLRKR